MKDKRVVKIYKMTMKEYKKLLGENNDLWDYPLNELDHIINDTDIEELALIGDRLYEL